MRVIAVYLLHNRLNAASTASTLEPPSHHRDRFRLIDYFALALCHALLLIALLRLARREDVDSDAALAQEPEQAAEPDLSRRERRVRRRQAKDGDLAQGKNGPRNGKRADA